MFQPKVDRRRLTWALALSAIAPSLIVASRRAYAQDDKSPITLLVGAASSMDFSARLLADYLREALGRPVLAVSKLGAGGRLALGELKRAAPDGRTLMLSTSSPFTIFPNIYTNLEYDPVKDFTPIAGVTWFDIGLGVGLTSDINSLAQLVDWVKRQPGEVVYGAAPGTGSASHFAGIALAQAVGLKLTPVPYKDSGPGILDLISGRLPIMVTGTSPLAVQHQSGKLRLLATSGDARAPQAPDVPTMKESGVDASIVISASLYGPPNLPPEIGTKLHAALQPLFSRVDLRDKLAGQGMGLLNLDSKQLANSLAQERKRYEQLTRQSGYVATPA
jgi:tripartite-type tricarboxylate transporter receptor subunit TctC